TGKISRGDTVEVRVHSRALSMVLGIGWPFSGEVMEIACPHCRSGNTQRLHDISNADTAIAGGPGGSRTPATKHASPPHQRKTHLLVCAAIIAILPGFYFILMGMLALGMNEGLFGVAFFVLSLAF